MPLSCLIVDDNTKFLEAARFLLGEEGLVIVGVATSSAEAVAQVQALRPDVALIDIELGEENGFDLAEQLHASGAPRAIIIISTHARWEFEDLIAAGPAAGFVAKTELSRGAIRDVLVDSGDALAACL
jgi:two-component system nitrate/nitrite response regulator NarL